MKIEMIKRNKDVVLGNEDLEPLYTMEHFPIYMGVSDLSAEEDAFADEKWMISKGSGMIQLGELVPEKVLYAKSHNSAIGKVWKEHHQQFADFLHKHEGSEGVLEIGGGNGILNQNYNEKYSPVPWTTIEPSEVHILPGVTAKYKKMFYKEPIRNLGGIRYDTLVHTHLVEHQFDIRSFMEMNRKVLSVDGVMIFSMPNMTELLVRRYPYALNFEHTFFVSERYMDLILESYGFCIIEKSYFKDHSIFYATKKTEEEPGMNSVFSNSVLTKKLYDENKRLFLDYVDYYKNRVQELNMQLYAHEGEAYIFGAHINTQLLLNMGLQSNNIEAILDNDPLKQGHRLYGTDLVVRSPKILEYEKTPLVILIMGAYNKEIQEDIIMNINSKTEFVF